MNIKARIIAELWVRKVPRGLGGYPLLVDAIELAYNDPTYVYNHRLTKELYPELARMHGITWTRVERLMRYAISNSKNQNTIGGFIADVIWTLRGEN